MWLLVEFKHCNDAVLYSMKNFDWFPGYLLKAKRYSEVKFLWKFIPGAISLDTSFNTFRFYDLLAGVGDLESQFPDSGL